MNKSILGQFEHIFSGHLKKVLQGQVSRNFKQVLQAGVLIRLLDLCVSQHHIWEEVSYLIDLCDFGSWANKQWCSTVSDCLAPALAWWKCSWNFQRIQLELPIPLSCHRNPTGKNFSRTFFISGIRDCPVIQKSRANFVLPVWQLSVLPSMSALPERSLNVIVAWQIGVYSSK